MTWVTCEVWESCVQMHPKAEKPPGLCQFVPSYQFRALLDGLCWIMSVHLGCFTSRCEFSLSKKLNRSCVHSHLHSQ